MEFDFSVYDQNHQRIPVGTHQLGAPWWPRWLAFANLAARNQGGDVDAATHLHSWISNHPAFEDVVYREFFIPTSPWACNDEFQRRIGTYMRDDILVRSSIQPVSNFRLTTFLRLSSNQADPCFSEVAFRRPWSTNLKPMRPWN